MSAQFTHPLKDPTLLRTAAYVNGQWLESPQRFAVHNPADGALLAQVSNLDESAATAAIAAANAAWPAWRALTAKKRAQLLRNWYQLMLEHQQDLATLMTAEQGKPLAEAVGEVAYGASFVEWFAEEAKRIDGDVLASPASDRRLLVLKQPVGVCAAITPWNFPLAMITRKVAPALAAGCTVVLKPAEQTPLTALALAELAHRAGIPAGVFNVLTADAAQSIAIGKVFCASPIVRKLTFTGSTEVGRLLMQQCAPTVKKLSLELGGHAPFIVFDDADLDAAVEGAMQSKYRNAGQTCICTNRFYVHDRLYDAFITRYSARVAQLKTGSGFDPANQIGPLIDDAALAKVQRHVGDAVEKGARITTGGARLASGPRFFQPTVLADVNPDMQIMREETFGPVAAVMRFTSEAEVIRLANDSDAGLASYFYARDIGRVWRVAEALECGMVGVNTGQISNEVAPFGGVKQSGLGREGSRYGIDEFLEIKYVCIGGIGPA
ncbi:MAG: NAD-dependent succinate-semialdehyde dehydrogenase [Burkholderiaceae bacterium]|nr:MAG: NAD-dependent succinate-semialdehyde dehydrogenase [Burkholderiaceae bacterium]